MLYSKIQYEKRRSIYKWQDTVTIIIHLWLNFLSVKFFSQYFINCGCVYFLFYGRAYTAGKSEVICDWTINCQEESYGVYFGRWKKLVVDGRYTSRYPKSISWVTAESGYDVERSKTPNEPRLETSLKHPIDVFYEMLYLLTFQVR